MTDDIRDELPDDLNAVDNVAAYDFPDNSRRRIPGILYGITAILCLVAWQVGTSNDSVLVISATGVAGSSQSSYLAHLLLQRGRATASTRPRSC